MIRYSHRIKAIRYAAAAATARFFPRRGGKFRQAQCAHRAPPHHKASDPTLPSFLQRPPPQTWMTPSASARPSLPRPPGVLQGQSRPRCHRYASEPDLCRRSASRRRWTCATARPHAGAAPPLGPTPEPDLCRRLTSRQRWTCAAARPHAGAAPPLGPVPDHLHARIASFCAEAANTPPESPVSPPLRPGKKQESDTLVDENGSRGNKKKDKGKEKEKRENKK
jgi:hypothetical protein